MTARFEQDPRQPSQADNVGVIKSNTTIIDVKFCVQSLPPNLKYPGDDIRIDALGRYCLPAVMQTDDNGVRFNGSFGSIYFGNNNRQFNITGVSLSLPVTEKNGTTVLIVGHRTGRLFPEPRRRF